MSVQLPKISLSTYRQFSYLNVLTLSQTAGGTLTPTSGTNRCGIGLARKHSDTSWSTWQRWDALLATAGRLWGIGWCGDSL